MSANTPSSLKNWAVAVCLLILVSSAAALYSIHASGLHHGESLRHFDDYKEAINSARRAQVNFKTQVQEWKNILLRGQNAGDYEEYLRRFTASEAGVDKELNTLTGLMTKIDLDPAPVSQLQSQHAQLGETYRSALAAYRRGEVNSILAVDRNVRGIDRKMNEEIDALVLSIDAKGDGYLAQFSAEAESKERSFRQLLLGLALATALVTFIFIFQALRLRTSDR